MSSVLGKRGTEETFYDPPTKTIDLTKYPETQFLSKNKNLQAIFSEMQSDGGIKDNRILLEIEPLVRGNLWREFDTFCKSNQGISSFFKILQAIFFLYYFSNNKISFDAKERALGIQQARWSVDPNNSFYQKLKANKTADENYFFDDCNFIYFQDIDEVNKLEIIDSFISRSKLYLKTPLVQAIEDYFKKINKTRDGYEGVVVRRDGLLDGVVSRFGTNFQVIKEVLTELNRFNPLLVTKFLEDIEEAERNAREKMNLFLHDTIWYEALGNSLENFSNNSSLLKFGKTKVFYGIPATYNISKLICYQTPILVFGRIRPKTMINFIIQTKMRPFAAHLPESTMNLFEFDGVEGNILINWIHDLNHQSEGFYCDVKSLIGTAKMLCMPESDKYAIITLSKEQFQDELAGKSPEEIYYAMLENYNIFERIEQAFRFTNHSKNQPNYNELLEKNIKSNLQSYLRDKSEEEQSILLQKYMEIYEKINPTYQYFTNLDFKKRNEIKENIPSLLPDDNAKPEEWLHNFLFQNCINNDNKGIAFLDAGYIYENPTTVIATGGKRKTRRRNRNKKRRKTYRRRQ